MNIHYSIFNSAPNDEISAGLIKLHGKIFGASEDLIEKMAAKPELMVIIAQAGDNVIGYKIGYELSSEKYYSWLGGVDPDFRRHGIAAELMKRQHKLLLEKGYRIVQTKTMNKWRNMLVLNIKNGFDVIDTQIDEKGIHKILLEKQLASERSNE
ncbi:GNAT family N-acetyltransferase [Mesobacillus jeotgali]|uniref:GNAT family N-acetyltransferase n=1 Tax=Mesobacillus jeotgali TaxID=129985 RepID=UPI0009A608DD|nr:GNAT family N-acetyltransferase [Mesobacillus jeotgali]